MKTPMKPVTSTRPVTLTPKKSEITTPPTPQETEPERAQREKSEPRTTEAPMKDPMVGQPQPFDQQGQHEERGQNEAVHGQQQMPHIPAGARVTGGIEGEKKPSKTTPAAGPSARP